MKLIKVIVNLMKYINKEKVIFSFIYTFYVITIVFIKYIFILQSHMYIFQKIYVSKG